VVNQFNQNLVPGLDLLFQIFDPFLMTAPALLFEGDRAVFKKFLLPPIKDCRLQTQFRAQVRYRHVLHQTTSQNGDLFGETPSPFPGGRDNSCNT
jgi:hypothetical protein